MVLEHVEIDKITVFIITNIIWHLKQTCNQLFNPIKSHNLIKSNICGRNVLRGGIGCTGSLTNQNTFEFTFKPPILSLLEY